MLKHTLAAITLTGILAASAQADVIVMKDGSELEGEILNEGEGVLRIRVSREAVVEVPATQVKDIIRKKTRWQLLAEKRAELAKDDADGLYALAKWCQKNFLAREERELLAEVIEIDPEHLEARRDLGYILDEGQWVLEADYYRDKGFERFRGKWVPKEVAERERLSLRLERQIKDLLKLARKGDERALEAEKALLELEPKDIVGALLVERLDDRKDAVRQMVAKALGTTAHAPAALPLLEVALDMESDFDLAKVAALSLWQLPIEGSAKEARTRLVQSLFHKSEDVRLRSARVMEAINDPGTIPYLIEALFLERLKRVREVDEAYGINRTGRSARGLYGQYNLPVQGGAAVVREREVTKLVYVFNPAARAALRKISGVDFDYDKAEWFEWWRTEGQATFFPPKPIGPQPEPEAGKDPATPPAGG